MQPEIFNGNPISPGIALGRLFKIDSRTQEITPTKISDTEAEIAVFEKAIQATKKDIEQAYELTLEKLGTDKAEIFQAHLLILEDPELITITKDTISQEKVNACWSYSQAIKAFSDLLSTLDNDYMKERIADLKDVSHQVIQHLQGSQVNYNINEPVILVAEDLPPSILGKMNSEYIQGIITAVGGSTCHAAILAQSLNIPAVTNLKTIVDNSTLGTNTVMNGLTGEVIINPDPDTLAQYKAQQLDFLEKEAQLQAIIPLSNQTKNGHSFNLKVNLGSLQGLENSLKYRPDGIGLFRTEFLFMERDTAPSEEQQFLVYKKILTDLEYKPVYLRTLDIGGDKKIPYFNIPHEENPFLGLRAIRYCLKHPDVFKTQLRAMIRASLFGNLGIMFPMVSSLEELLAAKKIYQECIDELTVEKQAFSKSIKLGIMIEIPAAALQADLLAQHVDFFSIGTNDLTQYTCAADRMNPEVALLYNPRHPAVIELIKITILAAQKHNINVSLCGELASDAEMVTALMKLGLKDLSMTPAKIPKIKSILRESSL